MRGWSVIASVLVAGCLGSAPGAQPGAGGNGKPSSGGSNSGNAGNSNSGNSNSGNSNSGNSNSGNSNSGNSNPGNSNSGNAGSGSDGGGNLGEPPVDGGAPSPSPSPAATEYAPYFYTWGWGDSSYAFSSLVEMKQRGGPAAVTIAFVLSKDGQCAVTRDIQDHLADVKAYLAAGGHVKASFGGPDGTYLENACADAGSLAAAIAGFVGDTGITDLDFDVEQGATSSNATVNARRAAALAMVQAQTQARVAFTLPVNPDGLDALGLAVVKAALDAGVTISFVNVMTMDYGDGTDLSTTPIASAEATARQLQSLVPGLSSAAAHRRLGVTPMIGHNDDSEIFSLDDARALAAWARKSQLGLVAFWAIQRDEPCPSSIDLNLCSGSNATTFDFHQILQAVTR